MLTSPPGSRVGGTEVGEGQRVGEAEQVGEAAEADDLDRLWARLREDGDRSAASELAARYYPLVRHVSRAAAAALSRRADMDDLQGYGAEGLLNAIERFDPGKGVQFTTFAAHRIRGAIYDGIRKADWAPRSVRRKERDLQDNMSQLWALHGRTPTEVEEARGLGVDVSTLRSHKAQVSKTYVESLDGRADGDDGDGVTTDAGDEPLSTLLSREVMSTLQAALAALDEREQSVVALSFEKGMTLAEIGRSLGVTESRVCQIRSQAIKRLRSYIYSHGMAPG